MGKPTPLVFVSHGSTMMMGETSVVTKDWQEIGRKAERRGIKGVVIMGAHWDVPGRNVVRVSTKQNPGWDPIAWVDPQKYKGFKVNCSAPLGKKVVKMLQEGGVDAVEDSKTNWIHDSVIPMRWMFPTNCPPCTLISLNAKYDPSFHSYIGKLLGPLRDQDILLLGTGGAVHNLFRNYWPQIVIWRNNFAQEVPPSQWALDFRQVVFDVMTKRYESDEGDEGDQLREGIIRLMHHPLFRDAHGTDDHYMAACYIAGAARKNDQGFRTSEVWELRNMCNSQYTLGEW